MRCAWWIGHNFLFRGEVGPARGWFARARRLLEREPDDCAERGYVLIAAMLEHVFRGDHEAAHATGVEIAEIGERFDSTLGGSSVNRCYEVDAERAFAERPPGLPASAAIGA